MKHAGGEYYTPLAQVHDPPPLRNSASAPCSAVHVCGEESMRARPVRKGGAVYRAVGLLTHDVAVLRRVLWVAVHGE